MGNIALSYAYLPLDLTPRAVFSVQPCTCGSILTSMYLLHSNQVNWLCITKKKNGVDAATVIKQ